jgi:FkbM family methyltransferase
MARLLAIEPNPQAFKRLKTNIQRNGVSNVLTFEGAVADAAGSLELNFVAGREEYSSLGKMLHPSVINAPKSRVSVRVMRLDDLVSENNLNPSLIKIDVEGAEHLVISGAMETLRKFRPTILSELSQPLLQGNGTSSQAVVEMIRRAGYVVKDALYPDIEPGQRDYCDIICTPT